MGFFAKSVLLHEKNEVNPYNEFIRQMYGVSNTGYYALREDQIYYDYLERSKMAASSGIEKFIENLGTSQMNAPVSISVNPSAGSASSGSSSLGTGTSWLLLLGGFAVLVMLLSGTNGGKKAGKGKGAK